MKGTTKETIRRDVDGLIQSSHNRLRPWLFRKSVEKNFTIK
ncbi:hypothetical protein [Lactococcus formosensis]